MKNKYTLFFFVAALSLTNAICTLLNANPGYWQNYNDYGEELNPLDAMALQHGPIVFLVFVAAWIFVIFLLMKYLPRKIGAWIGVAFWVGHMLGIATQGSYVIYERLDVGNMTNLICIMMLITSISTAFMVYAFLRFNNYSLHKTKTA